MPPDFYLKEALFDQTDVLNKPLRSTVRSPHLSILCSVRRRVRLKVLS
jgi:hypothetical protein